MGEYQTDMNNSQMECRYCHALGHAKNNCPKLKKSKKPIYDTPEPKSMLLARKYSNNNNIPKIMEKKNMFDTDFPTFGCNKMTQIKPTWNGMNFLASVTPKTEEIHCVTETTDEKTIIQNGVVLSVL